MQRHPHGIPRHHQPANFPHAVLGLLDVVVPGAIPATRILRVLCHRLCIHNDDVHALLGSDAAAIASGAGKQDSLIGADVNAPKSIGEAIVALIIDGILVEESDAVNEVIEVEVLDEPGGHVLGAVRVGAVDGYDDARGALEQRAQQRQHAGRRMQLGIQCLLVEAEEIVDLGRGLFRGEGVRHGGEEGLEELLLVGGPGLVGLRRVRGAQVAVSGLEGGIGRVVGVGDGLQKGIGGYCGGVAVVVEGSVEDEGEAGFGSQVLAKELQRADIGGMLDGNGGGSHGLISMVGIGGRVKTVAANSGGGRRKSVGVSWELEARACALSCCRLRKRLGSVRGRGEHVSHGSTWARRLGDLRGELRVLGHWGGLGPASLPVCPEVQEVDERGDGLRHSAFCTVAWSTAGVGSWLALCRDGVRRGHSEQRRLWLARTGQLISQIQRGKGHGGRARRAGGRCGQCKAHRMRTSGAAWDATGDDDESRGCAAVEQTVAKLPAI